MTTRQLKRRLAEDYGKIPNVHYFSGDMAYIRGYFDFRRDTGRDDFFLDEITWNDLDMDGLYRRLNPKRCTAGEQVLYYLLRCPAVERAEYARRKALLELAEADPARRLELEVILARLGCTRRADSRRAFSPASHGFGLLLLYAALLLLLLLSLLCAALSLGPGARALPFSLMLNLFVHEFGRRSSQLDYDTVNYSVGMVFVMEKLRRLHDGELDRHMAGAYACLERLRPVLRTGGMATNGGGLYELLASVTLLDRITYEYLKTKLGRCHEEVFCIHEHLGRLDAAISIASYRQSLGRYCVPELSFDRDGASVIRAEGIVHPLLEAAVPNPLPASGPMLITGSNASGKSTYLKSAALASIMAQSLCTVCAVSYEGRAFRVYSSMALRDDLLSGESYYMAEMKALKRILDGAQTGEPIFCVVDEVLRGTNTVERIAASTELLLALAEAGALCLAATHDGELCELLRSGYGLYHFSERLEAGALVFDYRLRPGKAVSHNAIRLLGLFGFDQALVARALKRAEDYRKTGSW